jgi:photosystem II stability/assembly factor-like uncharacterized protein
MWRQMKSPTGNNLYSVYMLDETEGWAVGAKGTILHFSNGQWEPYESSTDRCLYAVRFNDALHGMAIGELGTILNYTNNEWVLQQNKMRGNLFALSASGNEFWLGGILESLNVPIGRIPVNDESKAFTFYNNPGPVHSLAVIDDKNGWAVGGKNAILHFDGEAWENYPLNFTFPALRSVYFEDKNHGISAGYDGTLLSYRNNNWLKEISGTKKRLNGVFSLNNLYYAVGDNGTIISSEKSPDVHIKLSENTVHVYPNPADSQVDVAIVVADDNSLITLSVNDLNGKTIKTSEILLNAGIHKFVLLTSELDDAVYLLTITQPNKTETVKLVVQHN